MKLSLLTFIAFCLSVACTFAQNEYAIKGFAIDSGVMLKLANASIAVLNAKDSVLVKFTLAADDGSFSMTGLPAGNFVLLVSYPEYADYVEPFTLDDKHPLHNFGVINMQAKLAILKEVMIKGQTRAIKIKGDTTEFNARAFVTQPNAKVEDLLKQLPGIQIDRNGKITANGEAVTKVLLDGEEFFGDDPTLVTKNIRADMVDKVQLYDKKSDQAAFTGVDDGKTTKTINIQLKEDKKQGAFGKVSAGAGTNGYYEAQGFYNKFKAKNKLSIYGTWANDGKIGLGYEDNTKLSVSGNDEENDGIVIFEANTEGDLDSFDGTYSGKGIPLARSGGVHYDGKLDKDDKQSININYKIGSIQVNGATTTQTQQTLPNSILNNTSGENFNNYAFRQKLDAAYQVKIDTSVTLKASADGTIKTFNVINAYQTQSNNNDTLVNKSNRNITNNGTQQLINARALFTKKFKTPRRTFSWSVSEAYNHNQTKGYLVSETDYFNPSGALDSAQKINQYKTIDAISSVLNSNMAYSEPLTKYLSVVFNYGLVINNSSANKQSFDQSAPGVYNILDNIYTNNYQFNQLTNLAGAIFNLKKDKIAFAFGTKVADVNFKQVNELNGTIYKRDFINWLPQANLNYKISKQKVLSLNYTGTTTQPTLDQVQPVQENTDPLNVTLGNPNLKPSFVNNLRANYNSFQVISGASLWVAANYSFTANPIVNNTTTDYITDKTTIQYVNLSGKTPYNYFVYGNINRKIDPIDLTVGLEAYTNGNIAYSYINGALNQAITHSYKPGLRLTKTEEEKYDFYLSGGPTYTVSQFSLQPQNNNNAPGFELNANGTVYLPAQFQLASDITYNYTAKTQALSANKRTILNASVNKTFFKEKNVKLSLAVNNLFNQDVNFNRSIVANTLTQSTSTGIRRYIMFSVSWDFTSFAAGAKGDKED